MMESTSDKFRLRNLYLSNRFQMINFFVELLFEDFAFVFLPVIIYAITFIVLGVPKRELSRLSEWMFISIILFGNNIPRATAFYRKYKGFELKTIRVVSISLLGITIS